MKQQLRCKHIAVFLFLALTFISKKLQAQCDTIIVPTPIVDVRGSTDLCSGNGYLELCPSAWGYSNYQWYKDGIAFSTNSCIVITQSGSYTLAQQNGIGCWSGASTPVVATGSASIPNTPIISTTDTTTFCSGSSASLASSASSNNQWYLNGVAINGAIYQTYNATESGVYTVTTSNCGGISLQSIGITVSVIASPTVGTITGNNSICLSDSTTLANTTTAGIWSSSNPLIATVDSNGLVHTISAGSLNILYTVSNGTCSNFASKTIYVISNTAATIAVNGSTALCANAAVQLCPQSWGYSNYQWYKNGVAFSSSSCINITDTGSYTLQGQNSSGCASPISNAVVITLGVATTTPTVSAGGSTSFCSGGNVTLTSSAANGNQWYKDSVLIGGAINQTYTATETGFYTVTVTNCGSATSTGISVNASTSTNVAAIAGLNNICLGDSAILIDTTNGGVWSSSDTTKAIVNASGIVHTLAAGNVTISYTVTNGNCSGYAIKSLNIIANSKPTIDVRGSTTLCSNSTLELCPAVFGYSNYQWYKNDTAYSTSTCITITSPGSYKLTGENSIGCWSVASNAITTTAGTPPATPTISASSATTFCSGGNVTLTSSAANGNQWYKDSVAIGGANNQTYNATSNGVYTVVTTACGSSSSEGITVTVNSSPTVNNITGLNTICAGNTTTLSNTTSGGTWSSSDTNVARINASGVVTALSIGNTVISYTVSNGSCSTTATHYFTVFAGATTPIIDARSSLSFCAGSSVQLCPLVWGYSNYQWYRDGVAFSTSACITVTTSGNYSLAAQNGSGCWSLQSNAVTTINNPLPNINNTNGASSVCVSASTTLTNTSTIPSGGNAVWSSTAGRASVNNSGIVTGTSAGNANIRYTITSAAGCSSHTDYAVTVVAVPAMPTIAFAVGTTGITGSGGYCKNKTFTLVGTPSGGAWSSTGTFSITSAGVTTTAATTGVGSVSYGISNASGCTTTRTISANVVSCGPKGITANQQVNNNTQWTIYPNPSHSLVSFKINYLSGAGSVTVTDFYGKQIKQQRLSIGTNTVDVSSLIKGIYFVSINTDTENKTQKLIVE